MFQIRIWNGPEVSLPIVIDERGLGDHHDAKRSQAFCKGLSANRTVFNTMSVVRLWKCLQCILYSKTGRSNWVSLQWHGEQPENPIDGY